MATALERLRRFVMPGDLQKTFVNPLGLRLGNRVNIATPYGQTLTLGLNGLAERDTELDEHGVRCVSYEFESTTEGEPTRFSLRHYPYKDAFHPEQAILLEALENRRYDIAIDDLVDDSYEEAFARERGRSYEPKDTFNYNGVIYTRVGSDRDGHDCEVYLIRDTNGDGIASLQEATRKTIRSFPFCREIEVAGGKDITEYLFVEFDGDWMQILRGPSVKLKAIEILE